MRMELLAKATHTVTAIDGVLYSTIVTAVGSVRTVTYSPC